MAAPRQIKSRDELGRIRELLRFTQERARCQLAVLVGSPNALAQMKFERLGCDPLDPADAQNLAEQIDQQATYEAAADALENLWERHPACEWIFAPGAHGSGHDICSSDGTVAAEVFAAVEASNNRKLNKDIEKVEKFTGPYRYVFYRSPECPAGEQLVRGVIVVSLGALK